MAIQELQPVPASDGLRDLAQIVEIDFGKKRVKDLLDPHKVKQLSREDFTDARIPSPTPTAHLYDIQFKDGAELVVETEDGLERPNIVYLFDGQRVVTAEGGTIRVVPTNGTRPEDFIREQKRQLESTPYLTLVHTTNYVIPREIPRRRMIKALAIGTAIAASAVVAPPLYTIVKNWLKSDQGVVRTTPTIPNPSSGTTGGTDQPTKSPDQNPTPETYPVLTIEQLQHNIDSALKQSALDFLDTITSREEFADQHGISWDFATLVGSGTSIIDGKIFDQNGHVVQPQPGFSFTQVTQDANTTDFKALTEFVGVAPDPILDTKGMLYLGFAKIYAPKVVDYPVILPFIVNVEDTNDPKLNGDPNVKPHLDPGFITDKLFITRIEGYELDGKIKYDATGGALSNEKTDRAGLLGMLNKTVGYPMVLEVFRSAKDGSYGRRGEGIANQQLLTATVLDVYRVAVDLLVKQDGPGFIRAMQDFASKGLVLTRDHSQLPANYRSGFENLAMAFASVPYGNPIFFVRPDGEHPPKPVEKDLAKATFSSSS